MFRVLCTLMVALAPLATAARVEESFRFSDAALATAEQAQGVQIATVADPLADGSLLAVGEDDLELPGRGLTARCIRNCKKKKRRGGKKKRRCKGKKCKGRKKKSKGKKKKGKGKKKSSGGGSSGGGGGRKGGQPSAGAKEGGKWIVCVPPGKTIRFGGKFKFGSKPDGVKVSSSGKCQLEEWAGGFDGFWSTNANDSHEKELALAVAYMLRYSSRNGSVSIFLSDMMKKAKPLDLDHNAKNEKRADGGVRADNIRKASSVCTSMIKVRNC